MSPTIQTIVMIVLVAAAVGYLAYYGLVRRKRARTGGCVGCKAHELSKRAEDIKKARSQATQNTSD